MTKRDRALKKAVECIKRPECRVLAVKLDTLLPLPLWAEDDLYALMEADVRQTAGLTGPVDFPALRSQAAGNTLEEIYDMLSRRLLGADIRALAQRERSLRMRLPVLMKDVEALLRLAKRLGKRTILWSAWPNLLTAQEVQEMLDARGAEQPDDLFVNHWGSDMTASGTLVLSDAKERSCWRQITVPSPVEAARQAYAPCEALRYLGYRTLLAVEALHPSVEQPDPDAYGAFGMYLLSNALWVADESCRAGLDRVNFLARDGHLVKAAFERLCAALQLPVESGYVRISRQAAFPLHFRKTADLPAIPVLTDVYAHTPRTLLALFAPVVSAEEGLPVLREYGLDVDAPFNDETLTHFIDAFRARLFDEKRFAAYRAHARRYLAPLFTGRCATFDVGYNLRSETVIRDVTGSDLIALITHTDSDLADRRGVEYRALYGQTPPVSWVAREQFLLEDAPLCSGYDARGPVLSGEHAPPCPAIREFQRQALAFVDDATRIFGEDMARLHLRPADGCAPFERFLQTASFARTGDFRASTVENSFLEGAAPGDDAILQWRLMQTDLRREPLFIRKTRRFFIRLGHSPRQLAGKVRRSFMSQRRRG